MLLRCLPWPGAKTEETPVSSYQLHFVGADRLPRTLSEFDVARFFRPAARRCKGDRRALQGGPATWRRRAVRVPARERPAAESAGLFRRPDEGIQRLVQQLPWAVVLLGVVV